MRSDGRGGNQGWDRDGVREPAAFNTCPQQLLLLPNGNSHQQQQHPLPVDQLLILNYGGSYGFSQPRMHELSASNQKQLTKMSRVFLRGQADTRTHTPTHAHTHMQLCTLLYFHMLIATANGKIVAGWIALPRSHSLSFPLPISFTLCVYLSLSRFTNFHKFATFAVAMLATIWLQLIVKYFSLSTQKKKQQQIKHIKLLSY